MHLACSARSPDLISSACNSSNQSAPPTKCNLQPYHIDTSNQMDNEEEEESLLNTRLMHCQMDQTSSIGLLLSRLLHPAQTSHPSDAHTSTTATSAHSEKLLEINQEDISKLLLLCESPLHSSLTPAARDCSHDFSAIGLLLSILTYWNSILRKTFSNLPHLKRDLLALTTQLPLVVKEIQSLLCELHACGTLRLEPTLDEPTAELRMNRMAWRIIIEAGGCTDIAYFLRLFITQLQRSHSSVSSTSSLNIHTCIHTPSSVSYVLTSSTFTSSTSTNTSLCCIISTSSTSYIPATSSTNLSKAAIASPSSVTFPSLLSMLQSFLRHFVTETREPIITRCNEIMANASRMLQRSLSSPEGISLPIHAIEDTALSSQRSGRCGRTDSVDRSEKDQISTEQVHHLLLQLRSDEWDHVLPHIEQFLLDSKDFCPDEIEQWHQLESLVIRAVRDHDA